jgi:putative CocE/NonD family hydrolase
MRDGIRLYADIYRPSKVSIKVPIVLSWSPFGKKFNGIDCLKLITPTPWNLGITPGTLSGLEKSEGLDPAEWVDHGYAIVNIDSRGAFDSEGQMAIMGPRRQKMDTML